MHVSTHVVRSSRCGLRSAAHSALPSLCQAPACLAFSRPVVFAQHAVPTSPFLSSFQPIHKIDKMHVGSRSKETKPEELTDEQIQRAIEMYSKRSPNALSIRQFLEFASKREEPGTAFLSAEFLFCNELPIRVAHMCKIMDRLPLLFRQMPHVQKGRGWYTQTMRDIMYMQQRINTAQTAEEKAEVVRQSCAISKGILERHAPIVSTMASGLLHLHKTLRVKEIPSYEKFLDDLFMSRIGTRLCQTQHIELFDPALREQAHRPDPSGVRRSGKPIVRGVFEEDLDLEDLLLEAYASAKLLCVQKYGAAPDLEVTMYEAKEGKKKGNHVRVQRKKVSKLTFAYVPSHLYHILFELLKNSLRAVTETFADAEADEQEEDMPPIRVILVKAAHDLTIKIEDQGGGVPFNLMDRLFKYNYTTAEHPINLEDISFDMNRAPMAGFGYGLPMSRLYCRYFGGDLRLVSTEGYGVDSLIYLKRIAADAKETLVSVGHESEGTHFLTREDLIEQLREKNETNVKMRHALEKIERLAGSARESIESGAADETTPP